MRVRILLPCVSLLFGAGLAADPGADYQALLAAWKAKDFARALALGSAFLEAHPGYKFESGVLYMPGAAAETGGRWAEAERHYRALLARHPDYKMAPGARNGLVTALAKLRRLEECIAQCEANLEAEPGSKGRSRWEFVRAECLFRLWRFEQARAGLEALLARDPEGPFAKGARATLEKIDPTWEVDAAGVVQDYAGKYIGDPRFQALMADLPALVERSAARLEQALGLPRGGYRTLMLRFRDTASNGGGGGSRATTDTVGVEGKPVEVIGFYTEYMVLGREDFEQRLVHEMQHAAMRAALGQAYLELPAWVREGLALFGAGQIETRVQTILGNELFAGKDPMLLLDGIEDGKRGFDDYLEDGLAFEWLEGVRKGAVKAFCGRLLAGEGYRDAFAAEAGLDYSRAIKAAEDYAVKRVREALGTGAAEYRKLEAATLQAERKGPEALGKWLEESGAAAWKAWLERHPGHLLEPNAKYRLGKALVLAGRHAAGRALLQRVVAEDFQRSTICDDAAYWRAQSFEKEGKRGEAREAYALLLRDYTWSKKAQEAAERLKAGDGG